MQYTYVSKLSGGEKRRLYLLTVLMKNPNFIILDEPTNDLDLLTLNKLEEFLLQYNGCLILVSHDRYFMDKLTDHLLIFKGDGVVEDRFCSYSEYREEEKESEKEIKEIQKTEQAPPKTTQVKKKLSFKEKHEYEQLEKEVSELEKEKAELDAALKDPANSDYEKIMELSERLGKVVELIDEKSLRWMELDELA